MGGGVGLIRAAESVVVESDVRDDYAAGVELLRNAITAPLEEIANNAGKEGRVVVNNVRESSGSYGFNVRPEEYENLVEADVIDPAKVTKNSLKYAVSVAGALFTTNVAITQLEDDDSDGTPAGAGAPGGMGGGMTGMM